jgi:hypothetical protein
MIEVTCSSDTVVMMYQATLRHIPKNNPCNDTCENFRCGVEYKFYISYPKYCGCAKVGHLIVFETRYFWDAYEVYCCPTESSSLRNHRCENFRNKGTVLAFLLVLCESSSTALEMEPKFSDFYNDQRGRKKQKK